LQPLSAEVVRFVFGSMPVQFTSLRRRGSFTGNLHWTVNFPPTAFQIEEKNRELQGKQALRGVRIPTCGCMPQAQRREQRK
jgi:hypothetical protein